jgi:hypothetical protein
VLAPYFRSIVQAAASRLREMSTPVRLPRHPIKSAIKHSLAPGAQQTSKTASPGCGSKM